MGHGERKAEALDIENFLALPKELEGIHSGGTTINGIKYTSWRTTKDANGNDVSVGIDPEEMKRLTKKHGATNEYDWRCNKLGTKWGTYESALRKSKKGEVAYDFQTAWSPFSMDVLLIISKKYPTLEFEYKFAEQGAGFWGKLVARAGGIVDEDEGSTEGKWIAQGDDGDGEWDEGAFPDPDYVELLGRSG